MLYINENTIELTRGDTAYLAVDIDHGGEPYTVKSDDVLTLTVKKNVSDETPAFAKSATGSSTLHIEPADTAALGFGSYVYDVQLNSADGDVFTVIGVSSFVILPEVTQ